MGQSDSRNTSFSSEQSEQLQDAVSLIQDEILHQTSQLLPAALCNYDEFQKQIDELNALSTKVTSRNGKRLIFGVKKGSDSTVLWRATVRIAVVQVDVETSQVVSSRLLNLPQFLRVFTTIKDQLLAALPRSDGRDASAATAAVEEPNVSPDSPLGAMKKELTYSMLLSEVDHIAAESSGKQTECCICLERKTEIILPCAHAYCLPCIEQWNVVHKTCPICRETVETTDDAWVISDIPDSEDISREIFSSLMDLAQEPKRQQQVDHHG